MCAEPSTRPTVEDDTVHEAGMPELADLSELKPLVLGGVAMDRSSSWIPTGALLASLALHVAIPLATLAVLRSSDVGAGGTTLDAISIEMVSSETLESLRPSAVNAAASASAVPEPATVPNSADNDQPSPATPATTPRDAPSEQAPVVAESKVDPAPQDAPLPPVAPDDPKPDDIPRQPAAPAPEAPASPQPDAAPSVPAPAGSSSTARAASAAESSDGRAAASPGEVAKYAVAVRMALGRVRPKHGRRSGKLTVSFEIADDGTVARCVVRQSSGSERLDEATVEALLATKFPAPPATMAADQRRFSVPFEFK